MPIDTVLGWISDTPDTHDDAASHGSGTHETGSHSETLLSEEDGHDSHNAAHDMVVHVTYEDICELLLFCFPESCFCLLFNTWFIISSYTNNKFPSLII